MEPLRAAWPRPRFRSILQAATERRSGEDMRRPLSKHRPRELSSRRVLCSRPPNVHMAPFLGKLIAARPARRRACGAPSGARTPSGLQRWHEAGGVEWLAAARMAVSLDEPGVQQVLLCASVSRLTGQFQEAAIQGSLSLDQAGASCLYPRLIARQCDVRGSEHAPHLGRLRSTSSGSGSNHVRGR